MSRQTSFVVAKSMMDGSIDNINQRARGSRTSQSACAEQDASSDGPLMTAEFAVFQPHMRHDRANTRNSTDHNHAWAVEEKTGSKANG